VYGSVTLRQLLTHTGLLPNEAGAAWSVAWELNNSAKPMPEQRALFLSAVMAAAPEHTASGRYEYSNQGYTLAGHLLELATGQTYEDLLTEELFRPLGMAGAGFGPAGASDGSQPSDAAVQGVPWGHGSQSEWKPKDPRESGADNPKPITPAGRIHATMAEWAAFIAVHIDATAAQNLLGIDKEAFHALHVLHSPSTDSYCVGGFIVAPRDWMRGNLCITHCGSNTLNYCSVWGTEGCASLVTTNNGGCAGVVDEAQAKLIQTF